MEVESTIYALSSQHQGELFNVVIEGMTHLLSHSSFGLSYHLVIENFSQYRHVIATVPLKVVSKSDSLSATMPTPEGRRRTITDMLGTALNKVELAEIHSTKMLLTLCKSMFPSPSSLSLCLPSSFLRSHTPIILILLHPLILLCSKWNA